MFVKETTKLIYRYEDHTLWVEAWGPNAFRIRATRLSSMPTGDFAALAESAPQTTGPVNISSEDEQGTVTISNGNIKAEVSHRGKITMYNTSTGKKILEEYVRHRMDLQDEKCSALKIEARELKANLGSENFHTTMRLESLDPNERIYGMGQYQQPYLDLKGTDIELAQRNSQASVPFAVSSLGYGLLWNNPAIGRAVLGKNIMSFESYRAKSIDYWIVAGRPPRDIIQAYASVTGTVPMMPEYGLGFWQCKLRYSSQEELLEVAREYKR